MVQIKRFLKSLPVGRRFYRNIDNQYERDDFVITELKKISSGSLILDAGCGSQRYRRHCSHLDYRAQDFGQYTSDLKKVLGGLPAEQEESYQYGKLDYVGDIWRIKENDEVFDTILCTEVFEHIPHPIETLREFSRLLKKDGKLILTAPSNCLRHMDPYFFYSGFSDRWFEKFLTDNGFRIGQITPVGDYYSWLMVEMVRTAASHSVFAKLALAPAFLYLYNKRKTETSVDTLCMGYHVVAHKV
jgi:SAM-dependent methyltransferase